MLKQFHRSLRLQATGQNIYDMIYMSTKIKEWLAYFIADQGKAIHSALALQLEDRHVPHRLASSVRQRSRPAAASVQAASVAVAPTHKPAHR
jgi:hypothetical protein